MLQPAAAQTLARWHDLLAQRNLTDLPGLVHPDAVFHSPAAFKPYQGRGALVLILQTVLQVFEDFQYHRELVSSDGLSVVLEFSARVGDRKLKGIDLIRFDPDGLIVEFEVMVRPLSGLQALAEQMSARLSEQKQGLTGAASQQ